MRKNSQLPTLLVVVALAGCGDKAGEPMDSSPAPVVAESPAPSPAGRLGPISSRGEEVPEAPVVRESGQLELDLPADWREETPESTMRLVQATIPGAAGAGQFVLFYFGPGGGGGVQDNIARWSAQMKPRPGSEPQRDKFETNNCTVTWIEIEGTLLPSTTGMGPAEEQPDSLLLAAVVEGVGGPWFVKATGPAKTLKGQREAFFKTLRSVRTP
jgi:hypothetical protein